MFRASDIFGRKPGDIPDRSAAKSKDSTAQKRSLPSDGLKSRTWDPATGKFVEEDIPADVQELMGISKKVKSEAQEFQNAAWGEPKRTAVAAVVKAEITKAPSTLPKVGKVDTTTPSVEYRGFSKVELNDRYYERGGVLIHGRPTYWANEAQYFIYWQGEVQRWAICDSSSFAAVKSGQYPGWAFKEDHKHLCQPTGWKEAWNGEWQEPELEVMFRSASYHKPQWDDQLVQKSIVTVEFKGFSMKELNTRYDLKSSQVLQGRPSYWDSTGIYFIYWQQQMGRWAICDSKCLEAVTAGQCPGWAYRSDSSHFANACSWMERRADNWAEAVIETAVIGKCTKGLKVELAGFSKQELNTVYVEKSGEEIQGKITFWDPSAKFFIYWQSSMSRWAICDKTSIQHARSGLAPGWAYRTDSHHFARASGWMEVWGNDWKSSTITCTVLEGIVRDHTSMVKSEPKEEEKHKSLSVEQYRMLVQKVYAEKNPSKLSDVGHLLEKYKGREHELYRQVCEKYEMDADELAATAPALPSSESKPEAKDETTEAGAEDDVKNHVFEDGEVPDLQPMEFAVLIQAAYEAYNPKKLQDLGRLLQKYRGRERELYHEVCQKYGVHPAKFHAQHKPEQG